MQAFFGRRWSPSGLGPVGQGVMMAALGAIAFSGKAIVAKLMYKLGADAVSAVGLRMAMAFPLFLCMAWWSGRVAAPDGRSPRPLGARGWWQVAGLGFMGYYLASTLDFLGLQYISASLERAILYLNPTLVLLLSALWYRQRVSPAQILAVGLAYAGVAVVWLHDWDAAQLLSSQAGAVGGAEAMRAVTLGSVLVFGSALSYAIYLMGSGQLVQTLGSLRLVGHASCVACVLCLLQWGLVAWWTDGRLGGISALPWQAYALSVLNAVACTVLPVWLVMRGVQLLGASLAAQVGMVGPLSTIWMAAWWLCEPVTGRLMLGTAAILGGIVILTRAARAPSKADPTRATP
ncbi:DMT family transporter [Aquabacterium soli]|uniref:DMT family transporter n=1 Tax=Aquabacterium soli TaxID=2493092 RepID=A0A3R8TE88_9BURK|nr:DMT family transporter [Aquabacterium soli]RRS05603.1 DMT family transporter [Aquabacterium soli]